MVAFVDLVRSNWLTKKNENAEQALLVLGACSPTRLAKNLPTTIARTLIQRPGLPVKFPLRTSVFKTVRKQTVPQVDSRYPDKSPIFSSPGSPSVMTAMIPRSV